LESTIEKLVQACRLGDEVAWEELIMRYQRLVYSIPRRGGLDQEYSAEVFQGVFEKLVKHLDKIEQPDRLGAWLVTTARRETWRLSQDERSPQLVASHDDLEAEISQIPCSALPPDEVVLNLEEQDSVRTAVAALDERCRCLLSLLFYRSASPSYAEVATTLAMPESSVGPTRARCLQKLRRLLNNLGCYFACDLEHTFTFNIMMESLLVHL
jgi:RNA polymerase sigma factor (sigma-70 family)